MSKSNFPSLFEPIQIGPLRLKNRIVMPPMGTNLGDPAYPGFVSARHKSYYTERARGGTALIILESTGIRPSITLRKSGLALYDDHFIPGLKELVQSIKECGAACGIQIGHAGAGRLVTMKVSADGDPDPSSLKACEYFAASPLPHPMTGIVAQELSHRQLEELAGCFADAAGRAKKAGFDAIEFHGAHGYLLNEFLSPYSNKRKDKYGGDIQGRSRFPLEVVKRVKDRVGDDVVLSYRMSAVEFVEGGLDINDSIAFAKKLEEAGVHIVHVSAGLNESPLAMNSVISPMSFPRGRLIPYAEQIKKHVNMAVITVQRINTPELADELIRAGKADLVATGRALVADPFWPTKAREGKLDEIRRCMACNQGCMEKVIMQNSISCLYNPEVGYEDVYRLRKRTERRKKILVVGAGVAGMEAAYVLATKGHDVRLLEREGQLGGTVRQASVLEEKKEFSAVAEYLENQLKRLGVKIELNRDLDIRSLEEKHYDEIVVATGSAQIMPKMSPGNHRYQVRIVKEVLKHPEDIGENIVILGGGSAAIETAEHLHHLGKNVTVIEMLDEICGDLGPLNRVLLLARINRLPIKIMLNTRVLELNDEGIVISTEGRQSVLKGFDTAVVALGAKPNPVSVEGVEGRVHCVGDCRVVGNAMDAIHDAFKVAIDL